MIRPRKMVFRPQRPPPPPSPPPCETCGWRGLIALRDNKGRVSAQSCECKGLI